MGCGNSKVDESKLVVLCRERRDLIRDAVDHRYALATSHAAYFRSLGGIGVALQRFVEEELVAVAASSGELSPVITIPSSEGKGGSRSKSSGGGGGSTPRSSVSHSHSPEEGGGGSSHLRFSEDSHLHLSSEDEEEKEGGDGRQEGGESGLYNSYSPPAGFQNPNYYYMNYMKHSTGMPSIVYQNPYPDGYDYRYPTYGGNEGGIPLGTSLPAHDPSSSSSSYYPYYDYPTNPPPRPASPPPPPPPPPGGSAWDFLDLFGTYEQVYSTYRMGSIASSPNSSEVREKEGIPDLEDEIEQEVLKEIKKQKVEGESSGGKSSGKDKDLKASSSHEKDSMDHLSNERRSVSSPECIASRSSGEGSVSKGSREEEELVRKKGVTFEMEMSPETEKSRPSIGTALSIQGTRDVREVVKEIRDEFLEASNSREELSAMLEVGKLQYQPRKTVLRVISSRIFYSLPMVAYSRPSGPTFKPSRLSARRMSKATHQDNKKSTSMKSCDLSLTLEKLYVWEKKLYKEVKDEEKLRIAYEKKFKQLKGLDDKGAESYRVDATRAAIRRLTTKIDITIKSIDAISSRVQKLRDDELQPRLVELIHSWIRMWNSLLDCHRKQYQSIIDCKTRNLMARTGDQRNSLAKATKELELELLKWSYCFTDWISNQKTYLDTLNAWLFRCLDVKPEITPDGEMPFSPGRIGAPAIFIICNDWYQALNGISEAEVTNKILAFVKSVHNLWETQYEERRLRLKAEYLSNDLARRLGSLQNDGTHLHVHASAMKTELASGDGSPLNRQMVALDSMRNILMEEKSKHGEILKQVHEAASRSLREGLIPIFEALGKFILDMLEAYDELRIPNAGGRT